MNVWIRQLVMVSALVPTSPALSVRPTVNGNTPVWVAVPVISPVSGLKLKPAGRTPEVIVHAPVAGMLLLWTRLEAEVVDCCCYYYSAGVAAADLLSYE